MDLRHLALTRLPFETPAHTDERFESSSRREAQARLHPLIELRGIGLMTAEVGSGKTTVCRHVVAALHPGLYRVGYVCLTTGNVLDMDQSIAWELGLPTERSRATAYRALRAESTRLVCEAKPLPGLVIDEAQPLRNDVLEDLRLPRLINRIAHYALTVAAAKGDRTVTAEHRDHHDRRGAGERGRSARTGTALRRWGGSVRNQLSADQK